MNRIYHFIFSWMFVCIFIQSSHSQVKPVSKLNWKVNKYDLGIVLEEQGVQEIEFNFTHTHDSLFQIKKVWTDCGCTTVNYTQEKLRVGESGFVRVAFDPSSGAGFFSRMIVVQGNLAGSQDTLFVEGTAVPFPENPKSSYPIQKNGLGFRLSKVNVGEVFTNEPKLKQVEFYNFSGTVLNQMDLEFKGPSYLKVKQVQKVIRPQERGILEIFYDGKAKGDIGFAEDQLSISWKGKQKIDLDLVANVFEYFEPFSKEKLNHVPQLWIENKEINLGTISAGQVQTNVVNLFNKGQETLEIRKIQGNCECLQIDLTKNSLAPGESVVMRIVFDPKGRYGIDQRNIYLFSNDPVNPVQLLVIKSKVE